MTTNIIMENIIISITIIILLYWMVSTQLKLNLNYVELEVKPWISGNYAIHFFKGHEPYLFEHFPNNSGIFLFVEIWMRFWSGRRMKDGWRRMGRKDEGRQSNWMMSDVNQIQIFLWFSFRKFSNYFYTFTNDDQQLNHH